MKFVSIITLTYNHEKFIKQCLDSVINQTYKKWEMVIVDDASTDKTPDIVLSYSKKDKRIKIIKHKTNYGIKKLNDCYNQALKKTKGEIIAILEGDDFWPKDKLEKQIKCFNDPSVVLSYGDCIITNEKGQPISILFYHQNKNYLNNQPIGTILYLYADLSFYIQPVTVMIRKNSLLRLGGFVKNRYYPYGIDVPTFCELSLVGKFDYQNQIVGYYRKQKASVWFNLVKKTPSMGRKNIQNYYLDFVKNNKTLIINNNVFLDIKKIKKIQKTYIKYKEKRKPLTLFFHYYVFDNNNNLLNFTFKTLKNKNVKNSLKLFMSLVILLLPFKTIVLFFIFHFKLLCYRIKAHL